MAPLLISTIIFFITLLLFYGGLRIYLKRAVMRDSPVPTINSVSESENEFYIRLEYIEEPGGARACSNTAIVFIHGGAFFTGCARASKSLMRRYAGSVGMDAYLVKYPVGESDVATLAWISAAIEKVPQRQLIVVASSAGAFWSIYYMCYRYSKEFRTLIKRSDPISSKDVVGFVSLCGVVDADKHKPRQMRAKIFSPKVLISYVVGHTVNPYTCISSLDHIPFLLIDSSSGILSFAPQIERLKLDRNERLASKTLLYIFKNQKHNFMYNWSIPQAREVADIVQAFILTTLNRESIDTNIVRKELRLIQNWRATEVLCANLLNDFADSGKDLYIGDYIVRC